VARFPRVLTARSGVLLPSDQHEPRRGSGERPSSARIKGGLGGDVRASTRSSFRAILRRINGSRWVCSYRASMIVSRACSPESMDLGGTSPRHRSVCLGCSLPSHLASVSERSGASRSQILGVPDILQRSLMVAVNYPSGFACRITWLTGEFSHMTADPPCVSEMTSAEALGQLRH
jgi:hypothetical protein